MVMEASFSSSLHFDFGGEVMTVHQLVRILCNRFAYLRMAVAKACDIDTGREIDENISVHIREGAAPSRIQNTTGNSLT